VETAVSPRQLVLARPVLGGAGSHAASTARELAADGWRVTELALGAGGVPAWVALKAAAARGRTIAAADVVHVEFGCLDLATFWFAVLVSLARPIVAVVHDAPRVVLAPGSGLVGGGSRWRDVVGHRLLAPLVDPLLRRVFARGAVAVVFSESAREQWGVEPPRHVVVADLGAAGPTPGAAPPSSGRHVLFAGFIGPSKGLDVLLEAWGRVGPAAGLPLVIAGTSTGGVEDFAYERRLREVAAGLPEPPSWLGYVSENELTDLIAEAAIVVAPYRRSNPASAMIVRAMVEGRAIVATAVPAALGTLEHGVTGLIVASGHAGRLGTAIAALLDNPALRDRLGAAAAERAAERFTWRRHLDCLTAAYGAEL
jgi:glycosyltransferase involved in cell wall biosynthesis